MNECLNASPVQPPNRPRPARRRRWVCVTLRTGIRRSAPFANSHLTSGIDILLAHRCLAVSLAEGNRNIAEKEKRQRGKTSSTTWKPVIESEEMRLKAIIDARDRKDSRALVSLDDSRRFREAQF